MLNIYIYIAFLLLTTPKLIKLIVFSFKFFIGDLSRTGFDLTIRLEEKTRFDVELDKTVYLRMCFLFIGSAEQPSARQV